MHFQFWLNLNNIVNMFTKIALFMYITFYRGRRTGEAGESCASPEFRGFTAEEFLASWIYEGGSFSYLTGKKLVPRPLTFYICSPRDPFETPWLEEFFLLNQLGISDFEVFQCKCNLRNKIVGYIYRVFQIDSNKSH